MAVVIREYDPTKDLLGAEEVDRVCEVGPSGTMSLYTDHLGEPLARIRNSPAYLMLVAETTGPTKQIVGLVRGTVKMVTCGKKTKRGAKISSPIYTKVGYILGLRIHPSHRRMGIGLLLVRRMEDWFKEKGSEYSYMATEKDNEASVQLFTGRCGYTKFRTPSILVHPVYAHRRRISRHVSIIQLSPSDAEALYRARFALIEFFPRDIDKVLANPLTLGTFLAVSENDYQWPGIEAFLKNPPESWAVVSVWDLDSVFRLELRGAPALWRGVAAVSRAVDRMAPWLNVPAIPNIFRSFGTWFMYGLGGEGSKKARMVRSLCAYVHNNARGRVSVLATEVAASDPVRKAVPKWKRLSCDEDLWCLKRLGEEYSDGEVGDWTKSTPGSTIFVDPREV
ncbi:Acyl-CoA N-acyltransferases (NAT) superfamily protein [Rhynchospora pubera]|uniref:Acyl-CoA N-acyltransferases (NAT) superfamily protein n=1 Tax=Rhynchospora pubera TaxID=906938 RepID=A0AAV8FY12_9POAL|nr:Acyl-CoA N-acyltransferases (NAT) superfamily protein [Rhynchospora pubera]